MNTTIPNFLKKRAFLTPKRTAITFKDKSFTFEELYNEVIIVSGKLTSKGVKQGDYIAVLLINHIDTVVILLALQLLGVKAVILNHRLTARELVWQLHDSKVVLLLTEHLFTPILNEMEMTQLSVLKKEDLFLLPFQEPNILSEVELSDVCTVMYTSGTTGFPKGVLHTYGNHWWSAVGSALNLGLKEEDAWVCAVPLFHISGYSILIRSIIYGIKIVLYESFSEKWIIKDIHREHVTIMSVVTTMLKRIVDSLGEERFPSHFRCMLLGGGPVPPLLLEKCIEKQIPVFQTYGLTETSSQIVTLSPEYAISKLGSAGKALFPSELKILGEDGDVLCANQPGEIVVKGPNVTIGYLNHPTKLDNGWLRTGDIGYFDEEGFLFVLDRRSDLIISGGENIYPAEIEGVLTSFYKVNDAGVIGEKNETWGEIPVAFVVKNPDENVTENEIIHFCHQKLAKYKVPKKIYFIEEIPRNASKKIVRKKLRNFLS